MAAAQPRVGARTPQPTAVNREILTGSVSNVVAVTAPTMTCTRSECLPSTLNMSPGPQTLTTEYVRDCELAMIIRLHCVGTLYFTLHSTMISAHPIPWAQRADLSIAQVGKMLHSGRPVIANVLHGRHFVLVVGTDALNGKSQRARGPRALARAEICHQGLPVCHCMGIRNIPTDKFISIRQNETLSPPTATSNSKPVIF